VLGDIVHIVLDAVPDEKRRGTRVLFRGVFSTYEAAAAVPGPPDDGHRNIVGAFLDVEKQGDEPGVFWLPEAHVASHR
jgi:hypothetical protein